MTAEKGRGKTKLSEISTRRLPRTVRALYMGAAVQNSGAVIWQNWQKAAKSPLR